MKADEYRCRMLSDLHKLQAYFVRLPRPLEEPWRDLNHRTHFIQGQLEYPPERGAVKFKHLTYSFKDLVAETKEHIRGRMLGYLNSLRTFLDHHPRPLEGPWRDFNNRALFIQGQLERPPERGVGRLIKHLFDMLKDLVADVKERSRRPRPVDLDKLD